MRAHCLRTLADAGLDDVDAVENRLADDRLLPAGHPDLLPGEILDAILGVSDYLAYPVFDDLVVHPNLPPDTIVQVMRELLAAAAAYGSHPRYGLERHETVPLLMRMIQHARITGDVLTDIAASDTSHRLYGWLDDTSLVATLAANDHVTDEDLLALLASNPRDHDLTFAVMRVLTTGPRAGQFTGAALPVTIERYLTTPRFTRTPDYDYDWDNDWWGTTGDAVDRVLLGGDLYPGCVLTDEQRSRLLIAALAR